MERNLKGVASWQRVEPGGAGQQVALLGKLVVRLAAARYSAAAAAVSPDSSSKCAWPYG
ncbi:hypothetical protein ACTMTI_29155 [Nonomuraea sp. H19]|uniref:hypothetical protein n=1 Tax=Nonomuraea sp. H19 TaxID=3452206 RepID=UPI003F8CCCE0